MPKIERNFSKSKMNRDLDERVVSNGEYREALNIQISASEDSNVGTAQNLLGNTWIQSENTTISKTMGDLVGQGVVPAGSTCVGSITDDKNDKIYWLVAGPEFKTACRESCDYTTVGSWKDYILEYDIRTEAIKYVFVDIYQVNTLQTASTTNTRTIPVTSNTGIRTDMTVKGFVSTSSGGMTMGGEGDTVVTESSGDNTTTVEIYSPTVDYTSSGTINTGVLNFYAPRLLNFHKDRLITGINIIEDMLFWTDDYSEPKKINIKRSIAGTGGNTNINSPNNTNLFTGDNANFHTRLVTRPDVGAQLQVKCGDTATLTTQRETVRWTKEENITVIKKGPLKPPKIKMSNIEAAREDADGIPNEISAESDPTGGGITGPAGPSSFMTGSGNTLGPKSPGDIVSGITLDRPVDFRVGDIVVFNQDPDANEDSFTDHDVRARVEQSPLVGSPPFTPSAGPYDFKIESIATDKIDTESKKWNVKLEQAKPLFEFKFPRFSYRYKYEDGEYSTFAPWSEVAFMPADYDYLPKKGYNLGMTNQARNIKIQEYIPEDALLPQDVIEVDILYKESNSPNVYTVKTIKATDKYPLWPHRNDSNNVIGVLDRGECEIESELIHAVVPSNQLLRQWDNVPRVAKSQEISGNRLVYGNYLQNYDISLGEGRYDTSIQPNLKITLESKVAPLGVNYDQDPTPGKSVKSLRTYQAGVVYLDEYGRETPVLTGDPLTSTLKVEKNNSMTLNNISVRVTTPPPNWAKYWKIFIKETSNEYYNLAMDRWYDAEDGNIWLSFQSADRNKVDEDTFLILKKQQDRNVPVTDKARYKILAIENDAPTFIKLNTKRLGAVSNNATNTNIGQSFQHFPFEGTSTVRYSGSGLSAAMGSSSANVNEDIQAGELYVRLTKSSGEFSNYYQITKLDGDIIHIDGTFKEDVNFMSPNQTWAGRASGCGLEFSRRISEDKAEFDGRFFVKIYKDLVLIDNLLNLGLPDYRVRLVQQVPYLNIGRLCLGGNGNPISGNSCSGSDYTNWETLGKDDDFGAHWTASGYYKQMGKNNYPGGNQTDQCSSWTEDGWSCDRRDRTKKWWKGGKNSWFIDRAFWRSVDSHNDDYGTCNDNSYNPSGQSNKRGWGIKDHGNYSTIDLAKTNNDTSRSSAEDEFIGLMTTNETVFKFAEDPAKTLWRVIGTQHPSQERVQNFAGSNSGSGWTDVNNRHRWRIQVTRFAEWDPVAEKYTLASDASIGNAGVGYNPIMKESWTANQFESSVGPHDAVQGLMYDHYQPQAAADADTANFDWVDETINWNSGGSISRTQACKRHSIQIMEPFFESGDDRLSSENPATWETEPKEDVGMDIYHEASQAYPLTISSGTNELAAYYGTIVTNEGPWNSNTDPWGGNTGVTTSWSDKTVTIKTSDSGSTPLSLYPVSSGHVLAFEHSDGSKTRLVATSTHSSSSTSGGTFTVDIFGDKNAEEQPTQYNVYNSAPQAQKITLGWSNCYSFGNGIESDRIRDDYNQVRIGKGVKASTVMAEKYAEDRRKTGMIHSGIYNSTSGVNRLNQFIQAESITKDLNPQYGSIQKLHTRDTNIVAFCEDKVWKVLANKNILFNPDGSSNVGKSSIFLGDATTFLGEFGISKNPESFAVSGQRLYFSDVSRGSVLRLSGDGITNISDKGMKDWFADNLTPLTTKVLGTFDERKSLYNITIEGLYPVVESDNGNGGGGTAPACDDCGDTGISTTVDVKGDNKDDRDGVKIYRDQDNLNIGEHYDDDVGASYYSSAVTLSFNERAGGWISFKSFIPEDGVSINNNYYTFKEGEIYKHHSNLKRNNFYNEQYDSQIKLLFNEAPGIVKSFGTLTYEGSQAKISRDISDNQYFNLFSKQGWYVNNIRTDLQTGASLEFKNKEGKWFSYMRGESTDLENLDEKEFSVQGIGILGNSTYVGNPETDHCLTIEPIHIDSCDLPSGCTDQTASNYDPTAIIDDGSCVYVVGGCMVEGNPCYNPTATVDDGSCCYLGCTDPTANNYDVTATIDDGSCTYDSRPGCTNDQAYNYDPLATVDDGSCCLVAGCTDPSATNYDSNACHDDGSCYIWGCMYGGSLVGNSTWWGTSPYSSITIQTMAAGNYNSQATQDDGSCDWCTEGGTITSTTITDASSTTAADGKIDVTINVPVNWNYRLIIYNSSGVSVFDSGQLTNNTGSASIEYTSTLLLSGNYSIELVVSWDGNEPNCEPATATATVGSSGIASVAGCTYGGSSLPTWNNAIGDGGPNTALTWSSLYGTTDPGVAANNYSAGATYDDGSCVWQTACTGNISIPDPIFEDHLEAEGIDWGGTAGDGLVNKALACPHESLMIGSYLVGDPKYSNVTGIEEFRDLKYLAMDGNILSPANTNKINNKTNPTSLKALWLSNCGLTSINLSNLTDLEELNLGMTNEYHKDSINNSGGWAASENLYGATTILDFSHLTKLKKLYLNGTDIKGIDLTNNPDLEALDLRWSYWLMYNTNGRIDLSGCTGLQELNIGGCKAKLNWDFTTDNIVSTVGMNLTTSSGGLPLTTLRLNGVSHDLFGCISSGQSCYSYVLDISNLHKLTHLKMTHNAVTDNAYLKTNWAAQGGSENWNAFRKITLSSSLDLKAMVIDSGGKFAIRGPMGPANWRLWKPVIRLVVGAGTWDWNGTTNLHGGNSQDVVVNGPGTGGVNVTIPQGTTRVDFFKYFFGTGTADVTGFPNGSGQGNAVGHGTYNNGISPKLNITAT